MRLSHVIALDPTVKQVNAMARAVGVARFTFNWGLAEWQRQYRDGGRPSKNKLKKQFNAIKETEFPWIYESPKDANQQAFADLGDAFQNFFDSKKGKRKGRKVGYPKFKKKGRKDSFYVSNDHFYVDGKIVTLPVIGPVQMREALRFSGKIMGARVSRRADRWFISIQVEGEFRRPTVHIREDAGVDVGITPAIIASGWPDLEAPKPLKKALKSLKRANRILHRRKKGSQNRKRAARRLARIHQRVANIRKDFMHKHTTSLCRENQETGIEGSNVAGMMQNRKLARALMDVGLGLFRQLMIYKAPIYGSETVVADMFYPSSQLCSTPGCDYRHTELKLSEREWTCPQCGVVHDRNRCAAENLRPSNQRRYPGLRGNQDSMRIQTPMETSPSTDRSNPTARAVAEVGTKPCSPLSTN